MAVNFRLDASATAALRERASTDGVSQQEVLRRALLSYLDAGHSDRRGGRLRAELLPPRRPFETFDQPLELPDGVDSLDLLDRGDRI